MPGKRKSKNIFINFQADNREGKDQVYVSLGMVAYSNLTHRKEDGMVRIR